MQESISPSSESSRQEARARATLEAVLPLTLRDVDRAYILLRSLDKYFPTLGRIWVVVPDGELRLMKESLRFNPRCQVVGESEFVPEISVWARLHRNLPRLFRKVGGWYLQQLIKLAAADHVGSDFYLALDADVVCVKHTSANQLIVDGKALSSRYQSDDHGHWYADSAKALGLPPSTWTHGVTPAILSRLGVQALAGYLDGRAPLWCRVVRALLPSRWRKRVAPWRMYLMAHVPWTEYAIYFTYLEAKGLYERYHTPVDQRQVSGIHRSVWCEDDFQRWEPATVFGNREAYSFVVVQSNSRIASIDVWERVRPFLL